MLSAPKPKPKGHMMSTNNLKQDRMDQAGELPLERRATERRSAAQMINATNYELAIRERDEALAEVARLRAAAPERSETPADEKRWVAKVHVTNKGYAMTLAEYIAYALPEGTHELYTRPAPASSSATSDDTHAFKNFHRNLCARFGYVHDEIDWRRDQVSLEEFIAAKVATPSVQAVAAAGREDSARLDFVLDRQAFIFTIPAGQSINMRECYQLMEQDEDEDYQAISGDGVAYGSKRDAIDAAMENLAGDTAATGEGK